MPGTKTHHGPDKAVWSGERERSHQIERRAVPDRLEKLLPAVGALLGIVLNAILPGKDFAFSETAPSIKDAERFGGPKPKKD